MSIGPWIPHLWRSVCLDRSLHCAVAQTFLVRELCVPKGFRSFHFVSLTFRCPCGWGSELEIESCDRTDLIKFPNGSNRMESRDLLFDPFQLTMWPIDAPCFSTLTYYFLLGTMRWFTHISGSIIIVPVRWRSVQIDRDGGRGNSINH